MGMAASQARLLSLTARIHDVEYEAQMIQSAKLQLATQEDAAYKRYTDALDAQSLTFKTDNGKTIAASFNNLCGLASINNGMSRNYVFRTNSGNLSDDMLILPDEVYDAIANNSEINPYDFALSMIGVDLNGTIPAMKEGEPDKSYDDYIIETINNCAGVGDDDGTDATATSLRQQVNNIFNKLMITDGGLKNTYELNDILYTWNFDDQPHTFFDYNVIPKEAKRDVEKLIEAKQKLMNRVYTISQKDIFAEFSGYDKESANEYFAQKENEFNYYLRWAQLVKNEGGIDFCTKMSDYGNEKFADDEKFLTEMVQCGKVTIDEVTFQNGMITDKVTSAASDSNLALVNTSEIDATELKKAEAEYEHTMKQIDRKDKNFDMDLNKLETERTALTTEYDSVKKIVSDNIERTFKIFS